MYVFLWRYGDFFWSEPTGHAGFTKQCSLLPVTLRSYLSTLWRLSEIIFLFSLPVGPSVTAILWTSLNTCVMSIMYIRNKGWRCVYYRLVSNFLTRLLESKILVKLKGTSFVNSYEEWDTCSIPKENPSSQLTILKNPNRHSVTEKYSKNITSQSQAILATSQKYLSICATCTAERNYPQTPKCVRPFFISFSRFLSSDHRPDILAKGTWVRSGASRVFLNLKIARLAFVRKGARKPKAKAGGRHSFEWWMNIPPRGARLRDEEEKGCSALLLDIEGRAASWPWTTTSGLTVQNNFLTLPRNWITRVR